MTAFIIVFMCIAMIAAISSLAYVTTDVVMEAKGMDSYEVFWKWLKSIKFYNLFRKKKIEDDEFELESATVEDVVAEPEIIPEPIVEEVVEIPTEPLVEEIQIIEEPVPEIEPEEIEPVEEIEEIIPEIVEHVDAEVADTLMSDSLAMKNANVEHGAGKGKLAIINIGEIDSAFAPDSVVDIAALKACGLVSKSAGRLKILAHGTMNKPLTVKAESYSVQAIKMIELTGGVVIILKD